MRYRKKPIVIEAVRFIGINSDGDPTFDGDVAEWLVEACAGPEDHAGSIWVGRGLSRTFVLYVGTLEGSLIASPGDWIVRGIKGELYPVASDIFEATYEAVPEDQPPCSDGVEALDAIAAPRSARADSETDGDMLARLGMDGALWADEFCEAFPEISTADALPWFANAIMAGYDRGRAQGWKEDAPHGHPRFQDHGEVMGR